MNKSNCPKSLVLSFLILLFVTGNIGAQISFPLHSSFSYLKGSSASVLSGSWIEPTFNTTSWSIGSAPFWYGDNTGSGTELTDMQNNYSTLYLRSSFNAFNISNITIADLHIVYDDGFIMWINGQEVLRRNAPDPYYYNSFSTALNEFDTPETIQISGVDLNLQEGENIIAVVVFNTTLESSDLFFDLSITAVPGIPVLTDTVGINFSSPSGFYSNNFNLTISSPDPTATLIYTLDGSNPQTSTTSFTAGTSASILINPSSTNGRGTTPGVVVRASLSKDGFIPSYPSTRTYIYLDRVRTQGYPGYSWPNFNVNDQYIDYEIDPDVVNDSRYSSFIDDALIDIPTLSVATDNASLFDPVSGIYVNALQHGTEWERECSFELINPDGSAGFSVNAGLRIRGGWSRHNYFPKHGLRLFFRSEYGNSKLYFPLFGSEGVSEFDKIDLRCEQNYAWSNGYSNNTMLREIFSRDLQRDMGRPYTRSNYYHLYLNGMYWGIYQTQERSEARFAADYFGDKAEDYDVIKVNSDGYQVEATDGNMQSWQRLYNYCNNGFEDNAEYFRLEGKNASGNPVPNAEVMLDIDNLIDYMITIFYSGNFDAPTSSFGQNKGPNNFYAIDNRDDKSKGFVFFNHDGEHALFVDQVWPGVGLTENRVNIGNRTDDFQMTVSSLYGFHPQWLHHKLTENAEYRLRFADRAVLWLSNNGALTPTNSWNRFRTRMEQIDMAVIAESARWGDAQSDAPFTKDDHWIPQINQMQNSFFPSRTNLVITQLRQQDLYPSLSIPEIRKNGVVTYDLKMNISALTQITVSNLNSEGTVYYTLNDTDPRNIGGSVSSDAIDGGTQALLNVSTSAIIKARNYNNGEWSAMRQIKIFAPADDLDNLKITEIHYHPLDLIIGIDTTEGSDFEFMEFKNIGQTSLNLSGVVVDSAIYYVFPANTLLAPGQFYVIASKPQSFYDRYGMVPSGNFAGNLANSGEELLIKDASGVVIINFNYDDHDPWPESPDGEGPSMVSALFNPTGQPGAASYWRTSVRIGGSPFSDDTEPVNIEEPNVMIDSEDILSVYPNPTAGIINIRLISELYTEPFIIRLYNISGELIYSEKANSTTSIDLSTLSIEAGVYFIKLEMTEAIEVKKLIYTK